MPSPQETDASFGLTAFISFGLTAFISDIPQHFSVISHLSADFDGS